MSNKLSPLSNSSSALLEFRMPESTSQGGCLLLGGVCSGGVSIGGVCSGGVSAPRGSAPGGCLILGVSALGGGIPACTEADTPC